MTKGKGKKKGKKKHREGESWVIVRQLSVDSVIYSGKVRNKAEMNNLSLHTVVMTTDAAISTNASGTFALVVGNNPAAPGGSIGACASWASFAGAFDEYRVLAFECEWVSTWNQSITTASNSIVTVIDYDTFGAIPDYATADRFESMRTWPLQMYDGKRRKVVVRMNGIENAQFINIGSPVANYCMKFFCTGLPAAANPIIHLFIRYRVQFRATGF